MSHIRVERHGHVATITLDREERRNAFTVEMFDALADGLRDCDADPEIRCVVLTGSGAAFSAGLDLVEAAAYSERLDTLAFDFDLDGSPIVVMHRMATPVIAAVNGPAAGYAVGLALNADIRVMARTARLVPPTKRNLVPESGDTYLLPRLAGWERAARFFFMGEDLDGEAAHSAGIVSELTDTSHACKERAAALAESIAAMPPLGVQAAKRLMRAGRTDAYEEHISRVLLQLIPLFRTRDFAEAVGAFFEKRPAEFTGE
jgi:enoyl-CoA hydratase/carnithine racemase